MAGGPFRARKRQRGFDFLFGPFIPVGIRIGLDAAEKLRADPRGLIVTYYSGAKPTILFCLLKCAWAECLRGPTSMVIVGHDWGAPVAWPLHSTILGCLIGEPLFKDE